MTNDLAKRVYEHKEGLADGFTKKYRINKLVYFEATGSILGALERERQIKRWRRSKKLALIESINPGWKDLSEDLFGT